MNATRSPSVSRRRARSAVGFPTCILHRKGRATTPWAPCEPCTGKFRRAAECAPYLGSSSQNRAGNENRRLFHHVLLLACVLGIAATSPESAGATNPVPAIPSVGIEGRIATNLPGSLLVPKTVNSKAPVLVRVADTRLHGTLIAYDFRYIGLEAGRHDLRDYLVRADGSSTNALPSLPVEVASVLPRPHDGMLVPVPASPWQRLGGYRLVLVVLGTFWLLSLVPLLLRARPPAPPVELPPPAPTLADRLRPLIELAAAGRLDIEGKARLERLLIAHWRSKLGLDDADMAGSIGRLREHGEAGVILRTLEAWLHRPPGSGPVDLEPLLAPYRTQGSER